MITAASYIYSVWSISYLALIQGAGSTGRRNTLS